MESIRCKKRRGRAVDPAVSEKTVCRVLTHTPLGRPPLTDEVEGCLFGGGGGPDLN